jgi:hypothetical protein
MHTPNIERALVDPNLMFYRLDPSGSTLQFLEVTELSYRNSGFLDQRIEHTSGRLVEFSLEQVSQALAESPPTPSPMSFIFHSSMCCSTLLTRLLDRPGRALTLREPLAIYELSAVRHGLMQTGLWEARRKRLLETACALLGKVYTPGAHVVIKPSNLANALIDDLTATRTGSRGILLYSSLESFLISYLKKSAKVRGNLPRLAASAAALVDYRRYFPDMVPGALKPSQAAAVFWHAQMMHFTGVLERNPGRFKTLSDEQLLTRREATLAATRDWLRLPLDDGHLQEAAVSPHWQAHAKDPTFGFSPETRRKESAQVALQHRQEIEETLAWAEGYLAVKPVAALAAQALDTHQAPAWIPPPG